MRKIDIDIKLEKIEKNCVETAKKEYKVLKNENDTVSDKILIERVDSYKKELENKYNVEVSKLTREYNKNVFEYEMEERRRINKFRDALTANIHNRVIEEFNNFVNTKEYEKYLFNNIENVLKKVSKAEECTIYITERDFLKFKSNIVSTFRVLVNTMDNENIGGCILVNKKERISIDNTLKNNIEEKMSKCPIGDVSWWTFLSIFIRMLKYR